MRGEMETRKDIKIISILTCIALSYRDQSGEPVYDKIVLVLDMCRFKIDFLSAQFVKGATDDQAEKYI